MTSNAIANFFQLILSHKSVQRKVDFVRCQDYDDMQQEIDLFTGMSQPWKSPLPST